MSHQRNSSTSFTERTQFLKIYDRKSGEERRLAYVKVSGTRSPGITYIPGFMGKKNVGKVAALHTFCVKHGFPYIRYDATGLGESEGPIKLEDARFYHWLQDAEEILFKLTEGPQLVIASSMGAWITLILAKKHPAKFSGLLLIAPSINFADRYTQMIRKHATTLILEKLEKGESYEYQDAKRGPFPVSLAVFQEMIPYELSLEPGRFPVSCPVRIIHGTKDRYSPSETSLKLLAGLETTDVTIVYIKGADHCLCEPKYLEIIYDAVLKLTSVL